MWNYPRVFAHRGGGTLAPENTLAALRHGFALGFRAAEFDLMAARDGGLILMHDDQLGRTVAGEGSIGDLDALDLCRRDAGRWFAPEFAGETVPGFGQAASYCLQAGIVMNAEIKPVPGDEARTGRLVAQACAGLPAGSVLLSSFSVDALKAAQDEAPQLPRALLVDAVPADWRLQLQHLGAVALHPRAELLSPEQARAIKEAGYGLLCYTVNDPLQARALAAMGVDAICTDRLDLIGPDFFLRAENH